MLKFGLLGERLSHSFSPMIHAELFDYEYKLYEKKPEELDTFLRFGDFSGLNVTIPYKKAVIPFCGALSETARAVGSVNTLIRLDDGSLYGDNTDCSGFEYLLKMARVNPADGKTIVLGSGGSSQTVQMVLRNAGSKEVAVVSRNGTDNYNNISKHRDTIMIVNTTPVGMYPNNGISPLADLDIFQKCRAVIDLIYNPAKTELLLQAEERGILCVNGLAMLVAQAKKSAERFTNTYIPDETIETITSKIARKTQNIILIGMPGCGKSSIGAALAKTMSREFADTDEWVVESTGIDIPAIFAQAGEDEFRRLETDALHELCKRSGMVVATGGGIVKRPENRNIIRQNGIVIFLNRDIAQLPLSGRPLSESEGIYALAAARLTLYHQWSDYTVLVRGIEETAAEILDLTFRGCTT
jgi:shikimate dehydrogenase